MNKTIDLIDRELKAPFEREELEFKVGATNEEKTMGLSMAYVEARSIQNRLDKVVGPNNWKTSYREVQGGFICRLSLRINGEWISKEDGAPTTNYESLKGGISSSFKRVASSGWGIGRYLYELHGHWHPVVKRGKSYEFISPPSIDETETKPKRNKQNLTKVQKARLFKITFGKYSGKTLGEIYDSDRRYFSYLQNKTQNPLLQQACTHLQQVVKN